MPDTRLIERWLPIAEIGIESTRERTPMTPFPAPNRLHVWWARRPLVASRAAVLASLLPADADREKFLHLLGIHGDPIDTAQVGRIANANRTGERLGARSPMATPARSAYSPTETIKIGLPRPAGRALETMTSSIRLPEAGASRSRSIGLGYTAVANDLNPVAALIINATVEWPRAHGSSLRA